MQRPEHLPETGSSAPSPGATDPAAPLLRRLDGLGIAYELHEHPPYFTVEDGRAHRAAMTGAHTKNLFLKDKKSRLVLASALESTRVNLKELHRRLGLSGRLSFASAERMRAVLGVEPGSVTPLALINDTQGQVRFVLDEALMAHDILNFHPLRNTATVGLTRADFLRFMATIDHAPEILCLA